MIADEIVTTKEPGISNVTIVDKVTIDNINPVTSNAVAEYIYNQLELSDFE